MPPLKVTITAATIAAMIAYSIPDAPSSSFTNFLNFFVRDFMDMVESSFLDGFFA
ncbi:hypothetical protein D3C72_2422880 [compost metagenome]